METSGVIDLYVGGSYVTTPQTLKGLYKVARVVTYDPAQNLHTTNKHVRSSLENLILTQ